MPNSFKTFLVFALWIALFEGVSMAIGFSTQPHIDEWYARLVRPPLTPPNIVFPVMWTVLYALIASAGCLAWRTGNRALIKIFIVYMIFNWSWSFVFFSWRNIGAGLIGITAVDALALWFIIAGWQSLRTASFLMLPPFLWTLFATYLNAAYWFLNR